jgi:uncharacterized protein YllA (UPF0747 family)
MEASDGGLRHAGDPAPIDRQALAGQLERDPLAFSTSALLRPVVQDALLPAAAYVAGPSELAYFAELAPLYRRFGVAPSLVVPRARIALFDPRAARLCEQLGVPLERAAAAPDGITTTADRIDPVALAARLTAPFVRELDGIAGEMPRRDRLTERALRRTKETVERAAARIAGRIARAAAEGGQVEAERSARLAELLAPGGVPQERVYNFAGFAARAGVPETIAAVVAAAAPPTGELRAVRL